jgi:hypothetical protein
MRFLSNSAVQGNGRGSWKCKTWHPCALFSSHAVLAHPTRASGNVGRASNQVLECHLENGRLATTNWKASLAGAVALHWWHCKVIT